MYKLVAKNIPLSYTRARELLLNSLTAIGLDSKHFCLHSLRSGGASAATSINISDRLIKAHGRWRTDVAKDVYIKDNLNKQLVVSSNLGFNVQSPLYFLLITQLNAFLFKFCPFVSTNQICYRSSGQGFQQYRVCM